MKKRHTDRLCVVDKLGRKYSLPKLIALKYREPDDAISSEEFFADYEEKYTKPGMMLRGIRVREGLTQEAFAQLLDISQANLSKMELGKRPIGKAMAKRIAKAFDVNYRSLL